MIYKQKVVAFIPARGGSKGIKDKNIRKLGGKPLIAWPIETALSTPEIDRVIVSTDSEEIAKIAQKFGAEVNIRPPELAQDDSLVADTIRHLKQELSKQYEPEEIAVLLEATSPFREIKIISRCLDRLVLEELDSIATFSESKISPERIWEINNGIPEPYIKSSSPWNPRQSFKTAYELNAAVYAFRLSKLPNDGPNILFGNFGAEILPNENLIDIDTERDLMVANAILQSS